MAKCHPPVRPDVDQLRHLDCGADPTVRASLRKQPHPGYDAHTTHEYRDVTPRPWGERFRFKKLVSLPAMRLIAERIEASTA